jgi:hypothetical protein
MDRIVPVIVLNTVFKADMHLLVMSNYGKFVATYHWSRGFLFGA